MDLSPLVDSSAVEYCAFTVAIVLTLHSYSNNRKQWSHLELAEEVKSSQYGQDPVFYVDPPALHQGFRLFKKSLTKMFGHELIIMNAGRVVDRTFHGTSFKI